MLHPFAEAVQIRNADAGARDTQYQVAQQQLVTQDGIPDFLLCSIGCSPLSNHLPKMAPTKTGLQDPANPNSPMVEKREGIHERGYVILQQGPFCTGVDSLARFIFNNQSGRNVILLTGWSLASFRG